MYIGGNPAPHPQLSLDDGPNMFYVLIDDVGCCDVVLRWGGELTRPLLLQAGRVYVAITSKGYPSRYIYGSPDGQTRGLLQGWCDSAPVRRCDLDGDTDPVLIVSSSQNCAAVWQSGAASLH